ncbi:MAG: alpha/beta hydrolase family protein [Anaerolineales bacterium]
MFYRINLAKILLVICCLTACTWAAPGMIAATPEAGATASLPAPKIETTRFIPTKSAEITPAATQTEAGTQSPARIPTPGLYDAWSIAHLRQREYGAGSLEILEVMDENPTFTRYRIRYPSDDLDIYGFMNLPNGGKALPVIIAIHGYIDPAVYTTMDYTTRYADDLARQGFAVIHPNLRNYPPSDQGENLFRVGMAVDILNLIGIIRREAGKTGPLEQINGDQIGLWGHSMGGGISTRVMTVDTNIRAVLLYAAMSGNERQNFEAINGWSDGQRGNEELEVPVAYLDAISPENFFGDIQSAVSIHHGLADELVPTAWSQATCEKLTSMGKTVDCVYYKDMPHTFWGSMDLEFMENAADFFRIYLLVKPSDR